MGEEEEDVKASGRTYVAIILYIHTVQLISLT